MSGARIMIEGAGGARLCETRLWLMSCNGEGTPEEVRMREDFLTGKTFARS